MVNLPYLIANKIPTAETDEEGNFGDSLTALDLCRIVLS